MKTKQYLQQVYRLNELINANKLELEALKELSVSIGSINYSDNIKSVNNSCDAKFVNIVSKISDMEKLIVSDMEKMLDIKLQIMKVINNVNNKDEQLLLKYRYLNLMSWEEISYKMNMSLRTVYRIHGSALKNIKI